MSSSQIRSPREPHKKTGVTEKVNSSNSQNISSNDNLWPIYAKKPSREFLSDQRTDASLPILFCPTYFSHMFAVKRIFNYTKHHTAISISTWLWFSLSYLHSMTIKGHLSNITYLCHETESWDVHYVSLSFKHSRLCRQIWSKKWNTWKWKSKNMSRTRIIVLTKS